MKKLFISIFATITFLFSVNSQEKDFEKVSIDKLISETQFSSDNMDYIEFVWWVPTEYWEVVFSQDPTTTDAQSQEIIKIIEE
ncbi:hypothetical protein BTO05_10480 [Winogradskyella sp. PC-19]|uniref:hypothetical protein n=1 Tax=unclassified Winogradskyella TaxID=2615021 RepID=UPI000B3BF86B|nr:MULTISPECIES: hypothetical protein [unclassified Winogradskyella]ARV10040.1 hypothetical protein BTO05_10480 [Winogradskyella sp. PC-19]RZN79691.1 MAG: hypothetical protein EVB12_04600 [Winogradskyella sp.]